MYMPNKKSNSKEYFANLLGSYFTSFFPLGNAKGNHSEDHKKCTFLNYFIAHLSRLGIF